MNAIWQRVKIIAAWLFDQLVYPWIAGMLTPKMRGRVMGRKTRRAR